MSGHGDLLDLTQALMRAMATSDLTEAEWSVDGYRLKLSRGGVPVAISAAAAPVLIETEATAPVAACAAIDVTAPFPGSFYAASEPGAAPLAQVGQLVAEGDPLGVIEAMKTFTPFPSPAAGRIRAVLCDSGQEVSPDTVLFRLEPVS